MLSPEIVVIPDPRLRIPSSDVASITSETAALIERMKQAVQSWEADHSNEIGVALAAVQVGEHERVVIIRDNFEDERTSGYYSLINPTIVKRGGRIATELEGCLSAPGLYGLVPRYSRIRVKALDIDGCVVKLRAKGFLARVLQHELDHLEGILFAQIVNEDDGFFRMESDGNLVGVDIDGVRTRFGLI